MTKIDIFSGFLGAGKTTLIKKLIKEAFAGQQVVLIENEFGEIGIDGGFLKESGIQISEMSAGCICCSLVGDFNKALKDVEAQFHPDRILIEPSGVGKLSDVTFFGGKTIFDLFDFFTSNISLPVGGLIILWLAGVRCWPQIRENITRNTSLSEGAVKFLRLMMIGFSPVLVLVVLVSGLV